MIEELSIGCWAKIGSSSYHIIILAVGVGGSWIAGVSVLDFFEFCSIHLSLSH